MRGKTPLAKLTRPKVVAAAPRERLFNLLDDCLAHPAIWITAPPGSGKTTTLSGYAQSRKRPTIWYQIDGGDTDVATFFHYLGIAADAFGGYRRAEPLPALTPEYLPDLPGFTRRFFRRLFARLPPNSLLALDDYHEVPAAAPLHDVIACALAEIPQNVRCVIASRVDAPPECARLLANQAIVPIRWEALRLTKDETTAVSRKLGISDDAAIQQAYSRSDGWVAGLILLLGQPASARGGTDSILGQSPKALFDYFSGILESAIGAETSDVLLATAFVNRITAPLAAALSGNQQAERLLRDLHTRNYFITERAGTEPTYQLHALFREFLVELVKKRSTSSELRAHVARTADALANIGESDEAAALFGEAGEWKRAAELVLGLAPSLLMQGRWQTLQTRIAALPRAEIEANPWLQYWLGTSQLATDPIGARGVLTHAYEGFAQTRDALGQLLAAAAVIEVQFLLWSDFTALDRWIEVLERLLEAGIGFPHPETEIRVLTSLTQALTFRAPWQPQLRRHATRLLDLVESDAPPSARLLGAVVLTHQFGWLASAERSSRARAVARPLLIRDEILPVHKVWAAMSLAYESYTRADHADGDALFEGAFRITREFGLPYVEFWMHAADCWRRLDRREYKVVATKLKKLEEGLAAGRGMDVAHFHLVKGWLDLIEGRFVLARQALETAHSMAAQSGATYTESYHVLLLAETLIESGEYAQASDWLAQFRTRFAAMDNPVFEFNALLAEAYGAMKQQNTEKAARSLRSAFGLGRANGYVTTFNWYATMMSRLCTFALEHGIEVDYVKMLIGRRQLTPELPLESWPWPVRIHALGAFEMHANGEPLRVEGKAQHKPIELAKALIALGRDIAADTLIDILWSEPSEGDGRKALDITVHRLRKLLDSDEAVQVADRRVTLNPAIVWVDVWALERTLAPLIASTNTAEPDIALLEAATPDVLRLYRGHFLAGEPEQAWQVSLRNRLAGRFQRFVLRLGSHWESRAQWQRALDLYQRATELDPLAETFYRGQMVCLKALGRRAEAIEVFRRCRQALSVTLGIAPTPETDAVFRQLLAE